MLEIVNLIFFSKGSHFLDILKMYNWFGGPCIEVAVFLDEEVINQNDRENRGKSINLLLLLTFTGIPFVTRVKAYWRPMQTLGQRKGNTGFTGITGVIEDEGECSHCSVGHRYVMSSMPQTSIYFSSLWANTGLRNAFICYKTYSILCIFRRRLLDIWREFWDNR